MPAPRRLATQTRRTRPTGGRSGLGQLTLVEHALCPIDARTSLADNLVFDTGFFFTDANRHSQFAQAKVLCPLGLCAGDEFYLWGLLALTFAHRIDDGILCATPHYLLRQLGLIDQHACRGGRQYQQFAAAIERLSFVHYRSDQFYDPIRAEHRKVSFGFLSYSLPIDLQSNRAWRIAWDPIFFELTRPVGGHFWFDLATYREFDPACRRLFLFLCKVFARRATTPRMPLRHLGESVIGFAPSLVTRDLKAKVRRCVVRLAQRQVVSRTSTFVKRGRGDYSLTLRRGRYFDQRRSQQSDVKPDDTPLHEPLQAIGLDESTIRRLLRKYPHRLLQEWADITLAAKERFGDTFFRRSPQAYFIDNVKHAAAGARTPPDWWHELRKAEQRRPRSTDRRGAGKQPTDKLETVELLDRIAAELSGTLQANVEPSPVTISQGTQQRQSTQSSRPNAPQSVRSILSPRTHS